MRAGGRGAGLVCAAPAALTLLLAACVLVGRHGAAGSVATGKEAFFSPLRPVIPRHLPRFAFSRDDTPLKIPLVINIFLVNLDYKANNVFMALHASDLEEYLMHTFPSLQPSCLETGEPLHVKYDLWYHVAHIDSEHKNMLEHAVRAVMQPAAEGTSEHARSQPKPEKLKDGGSGAGAGVHYLVPIGGRVANSFKEVHDIYAPASARRYRFDTASSEDKKPQEGGFFKRGAGSSASSDEPTVQTYSLFVANFDKTLVAPHQIVEEVEKDPEASKSATKRRHSIVKAFTYAYYMDPKAGTGTDSWISSDRFAVVDLSAGPTQYGSTQAGDGAVIPSSIPRSWFKWGRDLDTNSPARAYAFQAQVGQLVRTAVTYVFSPDVALDEMDMSDDVLVAVIVLRDHRLYNPLEPGHEFSLQLEKIQEQVQRLALPEQTIHMISGLHNLQEHERVAIAVERSSRTDTMHEPVNGKLVPTYKNVLDSKALFHELKVCSDYLASGLMAAGHPLQHKFFLEAAESEASGVAMPYDPRAGNKQEATDTGGVRGSGSGDGEGGGRMGRGRNRRKGRGMQEGSAKTRILPVYVLSLQRAGRPPLIDGQSLFAASKDAVVVLQHGDEVSVPYFADTRQLSLKAADPSVSILAGIVTALGAVLPPTQRYSQPHKKAMTEHLFAHGWSPWGPFASSLELSQIVADQALRNAVLWRVDAAVEEGHKVLLQLDAFAGKYLFDPLGDLAEKNKDPNRLLDAFYLGDDRKVEPSLAHTAATNTLRQLHSALIELEADLAVAAEEMYAAHVTTAFHKAEVCLNKAVDLGVRTRHQLRGAEQALACCSLQHSVVARTESVHLIRALLVGIIAVSGVLLITLRDPERLRRVRAVVGNRLGGGPPPKRALD